MFERKQPSGYERRDFTGEIRTDPSGDRRLTGYAITFNRLSLDLGGFRERIAPTAMERTFQEGIDLRALVDHDSSKILGRMGAGTLRVRADGHGVRVEIDPPNTTAGRDIWESVERGDVKGMSFSFRAIGEDSSWWREDDEDGLPIREVADMRVREVSIVTFPAYPSTDIQAGQRAEYVQEALRSLQEYRPQQAGRSVAWLKRWHKTRLAS